MLINVRENSNDKFPDCCTFSYRKLHDDLTSVSIPELWHIGPKCDNATMIATTKNGIRSATMPLSRRYLYDRMHNPKILQDRFATDTSFAGMKSLHSNTCCQLYLNKVCFAAYYPKINVKGVRLGETLDDFVHDFGASKHLTFSGFQYQVVNNTKFFKNLLKYNIYHCVSALQRPLQKVLS